MIPDRTILPVNRHAGEIPDMLIGAGQLVKQCRLATVLIAGKRKCQLTALGNSRLLVMYMSGIRLS